MKINARWRHQLFGDQLIRPPADLEPASRSHVTFPPPDSLRDCYSYGHHGRVPLLLNTYGRPVAPPGVNHCKSNLSYVAYTLQVVCFKTLSAFIHTCSLDVVNTDVYPHDYTNNLHFNNYDGTKHKPTVWSVSYKNDYRTFVYLLPNLTSEWPTNSCSRSVFSKNMPLHANIQTCKEHS